MEYANKSQEVFDFSLKDADFKEQFSPAWWDEFITRTVNLSEPQVFPNRMTTKQTERMRRCILQIVSLLATRYKGIFGYRVFVEGKQLKNLDEHFSKPPSPDEDVEAWTSRVFSGQNFGIILNSGEKFNPELSRVLAHALQPYLEKVGMPTEGFQWTIFIGNYDMTPLGIHKDLPGKSGVHFHLGPGAKTMHVWEDANYLTALGEERQNNMDFRPHLQTAVSHTFREGDVYFLPENRFHLGTQDGLSIGIACWFNNRSKRHFAERLLRLFQKNYLLDSEEMLLSDQLPADDVSGVENTLQLFDSPLVSGMPFKDVLRNVYGEFRNALFSNGGLRGAPIPDDSNASFSESTWVQIEEPYQILCTPETGTGRLALYVRGTKLSINNMGNLRDFISALNGGKRYSIPEALDILGASWSVEACHYLLALLRQRRGIRLS